MRCSRCGADLVQVDNPFRKEFRHRRGVECTSMEAALEVAEPHMMASDSALNTHDFGALETRGPGDRCTVCGEHEKSLLHIPPKSPGKEVSRYADAAMFRSEPMPVGETGRVTPKAWLINATQDPLGSLAALNAIYTGGVRRSLAEVTDEERREALQEIFKNKLQGPLESIQFHFLLEGVDRGFTHQLVRGRRAFYAQETLRFAVTEGEEWTTRVAYPAGYDFWTAEQQAAWTSAIEIAQSSYEQLVNSGVPAEDARGLMPHAMTTRIHWVCSLRELLYVAGVRLCTQAQFPWRSAMASVVAAIRDLGRRSDVVSENMQGYPEALDEGYHDGWQFEEIAKLLRPICYQEGKCGFKSKADRACSIRERVDIRERHSVPAPSPAHWHLPFLYQDADGKVQTSPGIDPAEWLLNPNAAR